MTSLRYGVRFSSLSRAALALSRQLASPWWMQIARSSLISLADARLCDALRAPGSFTQPERSARLPLDERVLLRG